jgi:hypothetical protein
MMKRIFIAMFLMITLIFPSFSCGGDESPAMVPSEKVSEEIEDIIDSEGSLTEAVTLESEDGGFAVNIPESNR